MSGKSGGHHKATPGRMRWYIVLGAAIILLTAAVGYYIGQQTGPAPGSGEWSAQKAARPALKQSGSAPGSGEWSAQKAAARQERKQSRLARRSGGSPAKKDARRASRGVKATKRTQKGPWLRRIDQDSTSGRTDQVQTGSEAGPDPKTVVAQVVAALDDPDPRVRREALERLESVDHPAANAALSKALNDTDEYVRETAMDTMAEIGSPNILDTLAEALSSGDEYMRDAALDILEDIPDPRTVDLLIEKGLLNDNAEVQEGAFDALEYLTEQQFTSYQEARQWWGQNRASFPFDE